jgi:hypothetical protein
MVKRDISVFLAVELIVITTYFYCASVFANIQVAFLSSFFVIFGSSFAYRKMILSQLSAETFEDKRDLLESIEDPHELYDENEINLASADELDLRKIVKEEKAKIKTFSLKSIKHGAKGSVSLYRLAPYLFLVLGFIALENNKILDLRFYLPSLLLGIIVGSLFSKKLA